MIEIRQLKLKVGDECKLDSLIKKALDLDNIKYKGSKEYSYKLLRKSLDARKKPELYYIYSIGVTFTDSLLDKLVIAHNNKRKKRDAYDIVINDNEKYSYHISKGQTEKITNHKSFVRPVIIGFGPAGIFSAYLLALNGLKPIIIERGEMVDERSKSVERYLSENILNPESNIQFGEGGAGTFSDGKLNTLTKDRLGRQTFVLETFVRFGANESILYDSKPHIGTDILKEVVKNLREEIISLGGSFYFNTKLIGIDYFDNKISGIRTEATRNNTESSLDLMSISATHLVLSIGHSARDTFKMLHNSNIKMEPKDFAVGFRVVHPQKMINESQYGLDYPKELEAAPYKVTNTASNGRRVYSFCMCPGGYVVNASSEKSGICVNGMSYSKRDNDYANSAIIIGVNEEDFNTNDPENNNDPLKGMYFQQRIERKAYELGNGRVPFMSFGDFESANNNPIGDNESNTLEAYINYNGFLGQCAKADLTNIYPDDLNDAFIESMHRFGKMISGFDNEDTLLYGIEARTSSPVKIPRSEKFISNITGIYPCGEGAGYAGGIMSAAVDGLKVSEAIISDYINSLGESNE